MKWSPTKEALDCYINSLCQHLRKYSENNMENMHTKVEKFTTDSCFFMDIYNIWFCFDISIGHNWNQYTFLNLKWKQSRMSNKYAAEWQNYCPDIISKWHFHLRGFLSKWSHKQKSGSLSNFTFYPINSQDPIVNSPLYLLYVSFKISYKNLVLDQNCNFHLISLSILITCLLDNVWLL